MEKPKSSVLKSHPKPINVFYVWYSELCRRLNVAPSPVVKPAKPKCQTVLEFVADRLKLEEWIPVVNALRQDTSLHVISVRSRIGKCQFLHEVDTEEKVRRLKRKYGLIWTAYVLRQLMRSLGYCLRCSPVLTYLELDGLPLFSGYLEPFLQALKKNKTVKSLSFANSVLENTGCQMVCNYLRFTPNIEVLNLAGCGLSATSGEYLARLIKFQQINRYCESWHNSLRYENPEAGTMRGIKRITLNCNPCLGDEGLCHILGELEDDLWIKALDLQKCGVTENVADKILDVVEYNRSLEIVDLRQNELLNISTIERILHLLKQRQQFGQQAEFQWCNTAVTLTWCSVQDSVSKTSVATSNVHKTKSAPVKNVESTATGALGVRKTRTCAAIARKNGLLPRSRTGSLKETKQQVLELNSKLQEEIQKRMEIERKNKQLRKCIEEIKSVTQTNLQRDSKDMIRNIISKSGIKMSPIPTGQERTGTERTMIVSRRLPKCEPKNGLRKNGLKNGIKNGTSANGLLARDIFDKLLANGGQPSATEKAKPPAGRPKDDGDLGCFFVTGQQCATRKEEKFGSQASLFKFMEELNGSATSNHEGSVSYAKRNPDRKTARRK